MTAIVRGRSGDVSRRHFLEGGAFVARAGVVGWHALDVPRVEVSNVLRRSTGVCVSVYGLAARVHAGPRGVIPTVHFCTACEAQCGDGGVGLPATGEVHGRRVFLWRSEPSVLFPGSRV